MKSVPYESVWDAIADTPQEAASMKARSKLMMELSEIINTRKLRQKEAAELFGVTQPRISDLMRSKIHLFSLDMLMDMANTHVLTRTWLEVRKIWLEFIIYSTSTKLGKTSHAFFRDEYPDSSGECLRNET